MRTRLDAARRNVAAADSVRAARQQQALSRPLTDYAGTYAEPSFGEITFTVRNGRLEYRWGALYGPAELFDAAKQQIRIEIAGSGNVVTFAAPDAGPASALEVQGITFRRTP